MRCGKVCGLCTTSRCHNEPTEMEPLMIECALCGSDGCDECKDGYIVYSSCPSRRLGRDVIDLVHDSEMYEKGIPPVSGGSHEQDAWFINASRKYLEHKSEMGGYENDFF